MEPPPASIHPALADALGALDPRARDAEILRAGQRLAIYGSLAPEGANHHVLDPVQPQSWSPASLRARLIPDACYGAFPAVVIGDRSVPSLPVHLLESPSLPRHWERLDEFEGPAYRRTIAPVERADGTVAAACVYELHPARALSITTRS